MNAHALTLAKTNPKHKRVGRYGQGLLEDTLSYEKSKHNFNYNT